MRTLLLSLFTICALFVPMHQAEAKKPKPKPVYGGFTAGKTFTFTVGEVVSSATSGTQVITPAPPVKGIPKFVAGQQVKFTIGKKGELKGPGFNIKFQPGGDSIAANIYVNKPKKNASPVTATVHKDTTTGEPIAVSLSFFSFKLVKRVPQVTSVYYVLD